MEARTAMTMTMTMTTTMIRAGRRWKTIIRRGRPGGRWFHLPRRKRKRRRDKGEVGIDDENANKSAPGSDEKQTQNDQEKKKKTKKKDKSNKRRRRGDVDWYDVDDDWIDDEELDEYFDRDGRKTKHSGFFVNKGEIQNVNADGTTPVKGEAELTYKQKEQLRLEAEKPEANKAVAFLPYGRSLKSLH